jgi:two-component system, OmpR family, aerobic respiration control sensor histidine kinase ArcB
VTEKHGRPIPADEAERLAALRRYQILDTPPEEALDDLAELAARSCGAPIGLITLIDESRQWCKASFGLEVSDTPRDEAFCAHNLSGDHGLLIVEDAAQDERFADNPSVTGTPGIRFYAGAPLVTPAGYSLGALCVLDRKPRQLSEEQYETLRVLARQAQAQLELRLLSRELQERNEALQAEMEERRRRQLPQARLAAIIESSDDAILSMTPDGIIQSWNTGAARIYGHDATEMLGHFIHELTPRELHRELDELLARAAAGANIIGYETIRCRKDGSRFDASVTASPIREDGLVRAISWIVRDITPTKAAEREMKEALRLQQCAIEELRQASELKSSFVSVVGHEFRTPLTVIQGFSELIAHADFSEAEMREYANDIYEEAGRLTRLITDMLDLDRMQSGSMSINVSRLDLNRLITEVAQRFQSHAAGHSFRFDLTSALPPVEADEDRLRQVMNNLLSNAIKYSPEGGLVTVRSRPSGDEVHVSVRDEGLGIEPDALERIFNRYARAGTARDQHISGSGLGLPITRQILTMHGGRIWAESEAGVGSTFHFTLPWSPRAEG